MTAQNTRTIHAPLINILAEARPGQYTVDPVSLSLLYNDPMTQIIEFSLSEMQAAAGNYIRLLDFIKVKAAAYGGDQAIRIVFTNPAEPKPKEYLFLYRQIDSVEQASFWIAHQNEVGEIWTPMNMMKGVFLPYQTSSGTIDFHDLFSVFFALGRALLEKQRGLDGSSDLLAQADEMEGNQ